MEELIQKEASDMSGWITDKRLSVAPSKSKFMMVGPDRTRKSGNWGLVKVEVENEHIEQTRSEKLLGMLLNHNMTWSSHLHGK